MDRPRLTLPGGRHVAVWPVVNVEHWLIDHPMPRQILVPPTAASLLPDIPNWAWHEYGMRVGFWRFLEAFESRGIRPTLSINGSVCTAYPRIAEAAHRVRLGRAREVRVPRLPSRQDEIGLLSRSVSDMTHSLRNRIDNI